MRLTLLLCAALVSAAVTSGHAADDDLTEAEKFARDFSFDKVKLGLPVKDFLKRYPKAKRTDTDAKLKIELYTVPVPPATSCAYLFQDGSLYEMRLLYDVAATEKMGGWKVLIDKLVDKLGKVEPGDLKREENPAKLNGIWRLGKVDRAIEFVVTEELTKIEVTDLKALRELDQRKKKAAKTGFDDDK
jgi:hypothetical protein